MGKKIFIGGTGRSGTTILSRYLGSHSETYKIPFESRFITDKDGILDLYSCLSEYYSHDQGRIAIRNFLELLDDLNRPYSSPYLGRNLLRNIDKKVLENAQINLIENITAGYYLGKNLHSEDKYKSTQYVRILLNPLNLVLRKAKRVIFGHGGSVIPLYWV